MFDRAFLIQTPRPAPSYQTVSVTEKRAPTDESVKLLAEMEAKARDRVQEAIHLSDNEFQCVAHMYRDDFGLSMVVVVHTSLNGKRITTEVRFSGIDTLKSPKEMLDVIRNDIARSIANEALSRLIPTLSKNGFLARGGI